MLFYIIFSIFLPKVKLPLLDPVFLMTTVGPDEMINNSFECRDLVNEAMSYRMSIANIVPEVKITERSRPRKSYAGQNLFFQILKTKVN